MQINRIVHPGFWFGKSDLKEAIELAKAGVGGFCIYFGNKKEVREFTRTLQDNAPHKLIFSADYEYGLGRWLPDAPLLPSNISIGATNNEDLAYKKGFLTACQAKELGVEWVLAPVVDLADTPQNPIVNTRSFGADPKKVIALARAFMRGLEAGGCLNTLKHFPGHGSTVLDSHLTLPHVTRTRAQLDEADLAPYKELVVKADSIMAAHLVVEAMDKDNPASFSKKILTDYIMGTLRYKGAVVTDALVMKATGGLDPLDTFKAGADILLCPDNPLALMARLKEMLAQNPSLKKRAADALSNQEMMHAKLASCIPRDCKDPWQDTLSQEAAQEGVAAVGGVFKIPSGATALYLEPDTYPEENFKATEFLKTLKDGGVKIMPYRPGIQADYLVATTFSNYAAFSGQINFTREQKDLLNTALTAQCKSVLVSFGSPFVNLGLDNLTLFLMAGTQSADFQKHSAQILLGAAKAKGVMPV